MPHCRVDTSCEDDKSKVPNTHDICSRDGDAHVLLNADKMNRPRASSRSNSASRSTTRRWVAGSRCRAGVDISEGSNKAPGQAGDQRRDRDQRKVPTKFRDNNIIIIILFYLFIY